MGRFGVAGHHPGDVRVRRRSPASRLAAAESGLRAVVSSDHSIVIVIVIEALGVRAILCVVVEASVRGVEGVCALTDLPAFVPPRLRNPSLGPSNPDRCNRVEHPSHNHLGHDFVGGGTRGAADGGSSRARARRRGLGGLGGDDADLLAVPAGLAAVHGARRRRAQGSGRTQAGDRSPCFVSDRRGAGGDAGADAAAAGGGGGLFAAAAAPVLEDDAHDGVLLPVPVSDGAPSCPVPATQSGAEREA